MEQQAYSQKANIRAFQQDAINRYRNPDPWSFLANIAGGMSASKSTNLAQAFGYGVAQASNTQDAAKEKALADYDALAKEEETINNNLDLMHYRNATALGTVLDRQSGLQQTNLTKLQDQRNKLLADQNKVAKELNAKTPFEILSNQDDFDARAIQESRAYVQRLHPEWNTQRVTMEERALGLLSQAGDPFDSTKYKSALDQLNDKHKDIAGQVTVAPKAPAYTPQQLDMWVEAANKDPHALWSIPDKKAIPAVQAEMQKRGYAVPTIQADKELAKQAALSTTALMHVDNVARYAADPWFQQNVIGPVEGRIQKGLSISGFDVPGATQQQTREVQNFLSSMTYLFLREGRSLFGGRPPEKLMAELQRTSPAPQMAPARLMGALDAVRQAANIAITADRAYMYGGTSARPIVAVPSAGRTGVDQKSGRKVMTPGAGQPWYYMDDGSELKR
jgi:hypothetical protein